MMMGMKPPVPAEHKEGDRHAWAMLQRARPQVDWSKSSLRRADMTGEGKLARVMMGHDDDGHVWIGVARPDQREGSRNPHVHDAGSVASLSLAFHKLERPEHCLQADETSLEGCKPRRGQRGIMISVPEAGTQLLYWSVTVKQFVVVAWSPPAAPSSGLAAALLPGEQLADEAAPERDDAHDEDRADDHRDP